LSQIYYITSLSFCESVGNFRSISSVDIVTVFCSVSTDEQLSFRMLQDLVEDLI